MTNTPSPENFRGWVEGDAEGERIAAQSSNEDIREALDEASSVHEDLFFSWWDSVMDRALTTLIDKKEEEGDDDEGETLHRVEVRQTRTYYGVTWLKAKDAEQAADRAEGLPECDFEWNASEEEEFPEVLTAEAAIEGV